MDGKWVRLQTFYPFLPPIKSQCFIIILPEFPYEHCQFVGTEIHHFQTDPLNMGQGPAPSNPVDRRHLLLSKVLGHLRTEPKRRREGGKSIHLFFRWVLAKMDQNGSVNEAERLHVNPTLQICKRGGKTTCESHITDL